MDDTTTPAEEPSFESAIEAAQAAATAEEPTEEVETTEDTAAEEVQPEETTEAPEETPEPELPSSKLAAAARKERELRERQREIDEREARIKQLEEELQSKAAPEATSKPFDGIDLQGLSAQDLQALAVAQELGDETPDHVAARVERIKQEQRYKELERKLEEKQGQGEQKVDPRLAVRIEMKQAEIDSFVDSGVPSDYEMLSALSKDEPTEVKQAIEQLVAAHFKATNEWLSATAAAKTLNQELFNQYEKLSKLVGNKETPASTETTQEPDDRQSAALSDADTANHPDRAADTEDDIDFMELMDRKVAAFKNI